MVRPKATELRHRCKSIARNTGQQCGSPAAAGLDVCNAHIAGKAEIKAQVSTGERLAKLTDKALTELDRILSEGMDDAKLRAIKLVIDRSLPISGPHALNVTVMAPGGAGNGPTVTAAQRLHARMDELRRRTLELSPEDPDIIEAEIVDEGPQDRRQQPSAEGLDFGADPHNGYGHDQDAMRGNYPVDSIVVGSPFDGGGYGQQAG